MNGQLLVITPALTGGSWKSINRLLDNLPDDLERSVLTLGSGPHDSSYRVIRFPYPSYEKFAPVIESSFLSSVLYFLPWYAAIILFVLVRRPRVVLVNGLSSTIPLLVMKTLLKIRIVLSFHSYMHSPFTGLTRMVSALLINVDLAIANSTGSRDNLSLMIPRNRIGLVEHTPDDLFFTELDRDALRKRDGFENKIVILYVGRLDVDKRCDRLLKVYDALRDSDGVVFVFVGEGVLSQYIMRLQKTRTNILCLGYVEDRQRMHELYALADLTWSFADETYLALPAIESLASGTPIVIPELAAVRFKDEAGVRVNRELVPSGIGWIVSDEDALSLSRWIETLDHGSLRSMRVNCTKYAARQSSNKVLLQDVVSGIIGLSEYRADRYVTNDWETKSH